jgi:hypothetical protein
MSQHTQTKHKEVTMRILKYNFQIFMAWLVFIVLRKPVSSDAMKLVENKYKSKPREKKLLERIKKINNITTKNIEID